MTKELEEMIEDNKLRLVEECQKVLELVQKKEDWKNQDNISYIEQHSTAVFQYADVLVKQVRKLESSQK